MNRLIPILFSSAVLACAAEASAATIFGLDAEPTGVARLDTSNAKQLVVNNIGSSGQDGVLISFRRSSQANLSAPGFASTGQLSPADFTAGSDHSVFLAADLDGDGSLDRFLSEHYTLSSGGDSPKESLSADFSKIKSGTYAVVVEINSTVEARVDGLDPTSSDPSTYLTDVEFGNLANGDPLVERRLPVRNLGSSGQDGVSIDYSGVSRVTLPGLAPIDVDAGSMVTLEFLANPGDSSVPTGAIEFLGTNLLSGMIFTDVEAVPEPATIALAAIGLCIGLCVYRSRPAVR